MSPPKPVVFDVMAPIIDDGGDVFLLEDIVQQAGVVDHAFFPCTETHAQDDLGVSIRFEIVGVVETGKIVDRGVKVDVAVHVIAHRKSSAIHS